MSNPFWDSSACQVHPYSIQVNYMYPLFFFLRTSESLSQYPTDHCEENHSITILTEELSILMHDGNVYLAKEWGNIQLCYSINGMARLHFTVEEHYATNFQPAMAFFVYLSSKFPSACGLFDEFTWTCSLTQQLSLSSPICLPSRIWKVLNLELEDWSSKPAPNSSGLGLFI